MPKTKNGDNSSSDDHKIPSTRFTEETGEDEEQFKEPIASPSVTGEEDAFSGDATDSESVDIDQELGKVGLRGDEEDETPAPLGVGRELDEEE